MILPIVSMLLLISLVDIIFLRIPNWINIFLFFYSMIYVIWIAPSECFLGSFIGLTIFIACYFISKGSLGEGDIKLIPSLGLIIGYPGVLYLILCSSFLSLMVMVVNKKRKAQVLPFAPFLSIVFIFVFILQSSSF